MALEKQKSSAAADKTKMTAKRTRAMTKNFFVVRPIGLAEGAAPTNLTKRA